MITLHDEEFKQLAGYVRNNYGINLMQKRLLIESRLNSTLTQKNFNSFSEYYNYIIGDTTGNAVAELINKLTTNHTFFMRETNHFSYFKDIVLPYLESSIKSRDLRIWSAGCSTGEEPYTIAMIIANYFGKAKDSWDTRILATDISSNVISKAIKGVYNNSELESIPISWKLNYFKRVDSETSVISDKVKKEVIFRRFNLKEPNFPFKQKFNIIFCRNVMIYFDTDAKRELVDKFYQFTESGGYLFIGHSESLNLSEVDYKYIQPAIYRKG